MINFVKLHWREHARVTTIRKIKERGPWFALMRRVHDTKGWPSWLVTSADEVMEANNKGWTNDKPLWNDVLRKDECEIIEGNDKICIDYLKHHPDCTGAR
jgi:hypothetical protein|tara:strand:+ start:579 stop:878 length:300 start_codon:yes stop_codon:yes gene_type:complete